LPQRLEEKGKMSESHLPDCVIQAGIKKMTQMAQIQAAIILAFLRVLCAKKTCASA
jgi:hypothetical protein